MVPSMTFYKTISAAFEDVVPKKSNQLMTVGFTAERLLVTPGAGHAPENHRVRFTVRRSSDRGRMSVRCSTVPGTALGLTHYLPLFVTLEFAPGALEVSSEVQVNATASQGSSDAERSFWVLLKEPTLHDDSPSEKHEARVSQALPAVAVSRGALEIVVPAWSTAEPDEPLDEPSQTSHASIVPIVVGRRDSPNLAAMLTEVGAGGFNHALSAFGVRSVVDLVEADDQSLEELLLHVGLDEGLIGRCASFEEIMILPFLNNADNINIQS